MLGDSVHACANNKGRLIVAKIAPGVDLLEGIEELCQEYGFNSAIIVSCFGSLERVGFEYLQEDKGATLGSTRSAPILMPGPFQLITAQGTVSKNEKTGRLDPHMHAIFSDKVSHLFGGHLLYGENPVLRTMEIALQEVAGIVMARRFNPKTNSMQLVLEYI